MSKRVELGGKRLGSGSNMQVDLHGFSRSTHDLGRIWRSTMSAGTLVPFMVEYGLPGDVFNIDLGADVKTYPTLGPLFGSFKLQLDVFQAPIRLYNAMLHNNALGIGMNMSQVKLPMLEFEWTGDKDQEISDYQKPFHGKHINASSIHAYLGIRGLGQSGNGLFKRGFNAIPYLAYWDIYKNYYANKQEEIGMVVHGEEAYIDRIHYWLDGTEAVFEESGNELPANPDFSIYSEWVGATNVDAVEIQGSGITKDNLERNDDDFGWVKIEYENLFTLTTKSNGGYLISPVGQQSKNQLINLRLVNNNISTGKIILSQFDLSNIDNMREDILKAYGTSALKINQNTYAPYGLSLKQLGNIKHDGTNDLETIASYFSQEGLGIKTYQSDIFNNWLSTEWIDGENGINEITAIDTSSGSFKIDTLNLANKVYNMLNRIAVSGGSYDDWIEANWSHESYRRTESPVYHGGLSKEVVFQEVVSNSASDVAEDYNNREYSPLGSLAGKGGLSGKNKGGKVTVKIHEPSVLIGIVSLTPRIDYSQGNEWHINLKTLDDFHKPSLDEIGFQELITEQMAEWDVIRNVDGTDTRKSAGKQPAWINYMTSYNRNYGNFADPEKEMYMTLNRRYEYDEENGIKDLTTYIDPEKFNYLFAHTELSAQNFWVQIAMNITARRKMSAKVMPNL